jgi:hypothetical protein
MLVKQIQGKKLGWKFTSTKKTERNRPTVIDGFSSVFDLKNTAIRRESSDRQIVACSYAAHRFMLLSSSASISVLFLFAGVRERDRETVV